MDNEKVSLILRMLFQSPSGVLGVCRLAHDRLAHVLAHVFQSPSGVLGVCRGMVPGVYRPECGRFQSPSGVLGVCRSYWNKLGHRFGTVSVPFRGFRGLQAWPLGRDLFPS